jgi:transposase InsO family protein
MDERLRFIQEHRDGYYEMTELCERYGVSRKTGYKWLARFEEEGKRGLEDRSRAPHSCPHRMSAATADLLCAARRKHPDWGPGKLIGWLEPKHPDITWPAPSTVSDLFVREGLVKHRRRRRRHAHPGVVAPVTHAPNDLWTADFKGHFKTRDGIYCYPLTIADQHSRYLLTCKGLLSTKGDGVRRAFERAFAEYGLPAAMRTDNGVPFATTGIHGLSQLNVWWMRLGIQHQRIRPASPQENGVHERMHRTMKRRACRPPRATCAAQQRTFNAFRIEFNDERPHAALGNHTPASRYRPSPREYTGVLPPQEYPGHFLVKKITTGGTFRFQRRLLFVANSLTDHRIGLEEVDTGIWNIYFNTILLAKLDERDYIIRG